jgi:hypothetical protein
MMSLEWSLEDEVREINLGELEAAAVEARRSHREILSLRKTLFDTIAVEGAEESEGSENEVRKSFNALMNRCSDALDAGPKQIPDNIKKEREGYATAIRSIIDRRDQNPSYDLSWMIPTMGAVVNHTLQHASGPIFADDILTTLTQENAENYLNTFQENVVGAVKYYTLTYEQRRIHESRSSSKNGSIKVFGKGSLPRSQGGLRPLITGLHEIVQPKIQCIGKSPEELEKVKRYVASNLFEYSKLRQKLSRGKVRVLLDRPEARALIADSIKPTRVIDLISGHSNLLQLRIMAEQDSELAKIKDEIATLYLKKRGHASYCSQAEAYDIIGDVILGPVNHKLVPMSVIFTAFGYDPLPLINTPDYRTAITWNITPTSLNEQEFVARRISDFMAPPPNKMYA